MTSSTCRCLGAISLQNLQLYIVVFISLFIPSQ